MLLMINAEQLNFHNLELRYFVSHVICFVLYTVYSFLVISYSAMSILIWHYLDVVEAAVVVHFKVEISDGEGDAFSRMYGDCPDTNSIVRVRVWIVG